MLGFPRQRVQAESQDFDVVTCFRRIKTGGETLDALREWQIELQDELETLKQSCKSLAEELRRGKGDFETLQAHQSVRNECKQQLVTVEYDIAQFELRFKSADQELEDILCLPQVMGVRTIAEDIIVFRVLATIGYANVTYHLGTWDVYFGNVHSSSMPKPVGAGSYYGVRRAVETRHDPSKTTSNYYNLSGGAFCFGNKNVDTINKYARERNYLHAMQVIATRLSWVHPSILSGVPTHFEVYKPTEES